MNKKFIISYCSFSYNTTNISNNIFFLINSILEKLSTIILQLKIIQIIISIKYFPEKKLYLKIVEFLFLKKSRLKGSISLIGARFDDIILKDYNETLSENSELVTVFSPRGTTSPYFAEFGWVTKKNNIDVPQPDTLWKIVKGKELGVNTPITLEWVSPDGFVFTRIISVDENFMFTIQQKIKNNSNKKRTVYSIWKNK